VNKRGDNFATILSLQCPLAQTLLGKPAVARVAHMNSAGRCSPQYMQRLCLALIAFPHLRQFLSAAFCAAAF
jgi:hypothetical protein